MDIVQTIIEKAKAGYPALYIVTPEDQRALAMTIKAAKELNRSLFVWTYGKGLIRQVGTTNQKNIDDSENPETCLKQAMKLDQGSIVVLRHYHRYLDNFAIQAPLLDLIPNFKMSKRMLIITSPVMMIPPELEKDISVVEMDLPDVKELDHVLSSITSEQGMTLPADDVRPKLVEAARGLTSTEAESAFALSFIRPNRAAGRTNPTDSKNVWDPNVVMDEKCETARKTGIMTYYRAEANSLDQIGGLRFFKEWIHKRTAVFSEKAKAFGLPPPKGIMMLGPPGTGKSKGARAAASAFGLPLIRVDMGAIFGGLVGQSEQNARAVIKFLEAVAPCVAWLDEIEKGFAGSRGGELDSGVGARVLGTFLTWMQDKTAPVFVYATANNVSALPPELLRKGRFDEMFYVALPTKKEREEIFDIHIRARGRGPLIESKKIDVRQLAEQTAGFSGAEIEAIIVEALFDCFAVDKDLNMFDLAEACTKVVPLEKVMGEEIKNLMKWCEGRARPASAPEEFQGTATGVVGRQVQM